MKHNYYTLDEAIELLLTEELKKEPMSDHITYSVFLDTLNMLNYMYTECGINKDDIELGKEALRMILWYEHFDGIINVIKYDDWHFEESDYVPKRYTHEEY